MLKAGLKSKPVTLMSRLVTVQLLLCSVVMVSKTAATN